MNRSLTMLNESGDTTISRSEAISRGRNMYFTGIPCSKGHVSARAVSNYMCIACRDDHNRSEGTKSSIKRWREENRARIRMVVRILYHRDAEKHRKRATEVRASDPERYRSTVAKYRIKNRLKTLAFQAAWRSRNAEKSSIYSKKWRSFNRHRVLAYNRNYRARKRCADGTHTADDVAIILKAQRGRCAYCKKRLRKDEFHVDHVRPLTKNGSNRRSNLQITCVTCNLKKHNKDPVEFARSIGLLV